MRIHNFQNNNIFVYVSRKLKEIRKRKQEENVQRKEEEKEANKQRSLEGIKRKQSEENEDKDEGKEIYLRTCSLFHNFFYMYHYS